MVGRKKMVAVVGADAVHDVRKQGKARNLSGEKKGKVKGFWKMERKRERSNEILSSQDNTGSCQKSGKKRGGVVCSRHKAKRNIIIIIRVCVCLSPSPAVFHA